MTLKDRMARLNHQQASAALFHLLGQAEMCQKLGGSGEPLDMVEKAVAFAESAYRITPATTEAGR